MISVEWESLLVIPGLLGVLKDDGVGCFMAGISELV